MLFSDRDSTKQCYFRVPMTAAVLMERPRINPISGKVASPDPRWRNGNKVKISSISVSIRFSYCMTIQMIGVSTTLLKFPSHSAAYLA
jgi:hypothetical protein